ncbi:MAG: hypothetical protein ACLUIE_13990 [Parabacteroides merdae]
MEQWRRTLFPSYRVHCDANWHEVQSYVRFEYTSGFQGTNDTMTSANSISTTTAVHQATGYCFRM